MLLAKCLAIVEALENFFRRRPTTKHLTKLRKQFTNLLEKLWLSHTRISNQMKRIQFGMQKAKKLNRKISKNLGYVNKTNI